MFLHFIFFLYILLTWYRLCIKLWFQQLCVILTGCILLTEMCIIETLYCTYKKGSVSLLWALKMIHRELLLLCFWSQILKGANVHHEDCKWFLRSFFEGKKSKNSWFLLLKYNFFVLFFFSFYDSKLNIFGLWTKQDIWGRHLRLWETLINIFHQTTNRLMYKIMSE